MLELGGRRPRRIGDDAGASTLKTVLAVLGVLALVWIGYVGYSIYSQRDEITACHDDRAAVEDAAAAYFEKNGVTTVPGDHSKARITTLVDAGLVDDIEGTYVDGQMELELAADGSAECVEVEK